MPAPGDSAVIGVSSPVVGAGDLDVTELERTKFDTALNARSAARTTIAMRVSVRSGRRRLDGRAGSTRVAGTAATAGAGAGRLAAARWASASVLAVMTGVRTGASCSS